MQVTATEAKNRVGHIGAQAKTAPVVVEKDGRPDTVIVSYTDYLALTTATDVHTGFLLGVPKENVVYVPYGDIDALRRAIAAETGAQGNGIIAAIIEPIRGTACEVPPPHYLEQFAGLMGGLGYKAEKGERVKVKAAPVLVPVEIELREPAKA